MRKVNEAMATLTYLTRHGTDSPKNGPNRPLARPKRPAAVTRQNPQARPTHRSLSARQRMNSSDALCCRSYHSSSTQHENTKLHAHRSASRAHAHLAHVQRASAKRTGLRRTSAQAYMQWKVTLKTNMQKYR
jgi:hypothetical protein